MVILYYRSIQLIILDSIILGSYIKYPKYVIQIISGIPYPKSPHNIMAKNQMGDIGGSQFYITINMLT